MAKKRKKNKNNCYKEVLRFFVFIVQMFLFFLYGNYSHKLFALQILLLIRNLKGAKKPDIY